MASKSIRCSSKKVLPRLNNTLRTFDIRFLHVFTSYLSSPYYRPFWTIRCWVRSTNFDLKTYQIRGGPPRRASTRSRSTVSHKTSKLRHNFTVSWPKSNACSVSLIYRCVLTNPSRNYDVVARPSSSCGRCYHKRQPRHWINNGTCGHTRRRLKVNNFPLFSGYAAGSQVYCAVCYRSERRRTLLIKWNWSEDSFRLSAVIAAGQISRTEPAGIGVEIMTGASNTKNPRRTRRR